MPVLVLFVLFSGIDPCQFGLMHAIEIDMQQFWGLEWNYEPSRNLYVN